MSTALENLTDTESAEFLEKQQLEDEKKFKQLKLIWPAAQQGFDNAFFGVYTSFLMTDVYQMSVVLAGALQLVKSVLGWIAGPIFGAIMDRFSFKTAKYWPWLILGTTALYSSQILLFSMPMLGVRTENMAIFAFVVSVIGAVATPIESTPISAVYPLISAEPQVRSYLATVQKLWRDGGKVIFGYLVPILLVYFTAKFGGVQSNAYAVIAIAIGIFTMVFNYLLAYVLRNSYCERNAIAQCAARKSSSKKTVFSDVFKAIFKNRALLSMFAFLAIHKAYYFLYLMSGIYLFKYNFNNFAQFGIFTTVYNLMAIIGVLFGKSWLKIFKDTKRSLVTSGVVHIFFMAIIAITMKNLSSTGFIILVGCSSFFSGLFEAYIMPMFAGASDWGAFTTGQRQDGLIMSIYGMSVTVGISLSTIIRTYLMESAGYNAAAYVNGVMPPQIVLDNFNIMFSIVPLVLGIVCILIVQLFYPLNDKRLAEIRKELNC